MKIYYVYKHIRLDKNEPFYVGFGTKQESLYGIKTQYVRAFKIECRHAAWFEIVEKTKYKVEIIYESSDYQDVRKKEKELITLYKSKLFDDGTLVNASASDFFTKENKKNSLKYIKKRDGKYKRKGKIVIEMYNKEEGFIESFDSLSSIVETTGYSSRIIKQILEGKRSQYQGDYFKYKINVDKGDN